MLGNLKAEMGGCFQVLCSDGSPCEFQITCGKLSELLSVSMSLQLKSRQLQKIFYCLLWFRYRGRPTPAPVGGHLTQEKVEQPDTGGCTHASEAMVSKHLLKAKETRKS